MRHSAFLFIVALALALLPVAATGQDTTAALSVNGIPIDVEDVQLPCTPTQVLACNAGGEMIDFQAAGGGGGEGSATTCSDGETLVAGSSVWACADVDAGDAAAGTTRPSGGVTVQILTHDTDCTTLTIGQRGELCCDVDNGACWRCEPAAGDCDTAGEWKAVTGGSGLFNVVEDLTPEFAALLTMADGVGDSPAISWAPATGTVWSVYAEDAADDLQITCSTASEETVDFANTGAGTVAVTIDGTLEVTGGIITPAVTAPSIDFDDSDDPGTIEGSIGVNCPTANDCDMDFAVNSGADTETVVLKFDTADSGATTIQIGDPGTDYINVTEGGVMTVAGSGTITATDGDTATSFFSSGEIADAQVSDTLTVGSGGSVDAGAVGADHTDAITEIAAALKSGDDAVLVTGTAGISGNCAEWNADGDLVDAGAACGVGGGGGAMPPIVILAQRDEPPVSEFAQYDTRNNRPVLDFEDGTATTAESAVFQVLLPPEYGGGGLTCDIYWAATAATSGNVIWNMAIENGAPGTLDRDADSFAAANAATCTAQGTSGVDDDDCVITFTDGADMDSWPAGTPGRIKLLRDADNGSDTMVGDSEMSMVVCNET